MLHRAPPTTPATLSEKAVQEISRALIPLLSDVFALYLKTKNFHWHMSGPHFRDYHLMLDDQGEQLFSMTDAIAERARKLGGTTVRSIGQISRSQRIADNDAEYVKPFDMLAELRNDNASLTRTMREVHSLCDEAGDVATASLLENWIDESEKRTWFLSECGTNA
jgi:starvation-inducible DNA-binding protein